MIAIGRRLRRATMTIDAIGAVLGWWLGATLLAAQDPTLTISPLLPHLAVVVVLTLAVASGLRLYRPTVATGHLIATVTLWRATLIAGALAVLVFAATDDGAAGVRRYGAWALVSVPVAFTVAVTERGGLRVVLRRLHHQGRFVRELVLVGANAEAGDLAELFATARRDGFRLVGVVGEPGASPGGLADLPWLGTTADLLDVVRARDAAGAVIAVTGVTPGDLNRLTRALLDDRRLVLISSGLRGFDHRRLRSQVIAREALFCVEHRRLSPGKTAAKRALDLAGASLLLVLAAPVLALVALAILASDGRPVLFRQQRVGIGGRSFTCLKFRTMVRDAEARLIDLTARNEREWPLFKLADDPRVTRIGRVLRATSLDELPQLLCVLAGTMSLVGPRPALPSEVEHFDTDLRRRIDVKPGITGLWQIESRDDESLSAYRRLDLHYVDNWSVWMDVAVLVATVGAVASRAIRVLGPGEAPVPGAHAAPRSPAPQVRPLRIAMIGQRGVPATFGGIEHHVEQLGRRLADRGHEVTVYCRPNYVPERREGWLGMRVVRLPTVSSKHLDAIVHSALATVHAMATGHDILHFHALGPGLCSALPRVLHRGRVVQTIHGFDNQRDKWGIGARVVLGMGAHMSRRVPHAVVGVSHLLAAHYATAAPGRGVYVPNGVDRPAAAPETLVRKRGLEPGRYALFVGRLVPEKAPDALVRAFRRVPTDARLVIAGGSSFSDDYVAGLERLAAEDGRVLLTGYLYGDDLAALYQHAGVFVLPSALEGLPLTLLEAASHGVPIVASDIPPHREVLAADGPGRRLVPVGDEDALARAVADLLERGDPAQRAGAERTAASVLARYDWDAAARALEVVYRRVLSRTAPAATPPYQPVEPDAVPAPRIASVTGSAS
jgi:exopolysaccharide biosynthesis polyprenyl glycosylphosphotransferase